MTALPACRYSLASTLQACRPLLKLAIAIICGLYVPFAAAQIYPAKPIKIVVPFPPGGASDIFTRTVSNHLSAALNQPVLVENRPGASGTIGANAVAKSTPDGYTLGFVPVTTLASSPALYRDFPFDPVNDLEPIVLLVSVPSVLVARTTLQVASVRQLVDRLKTHPGTYASTGVGLSSHLFGELFKSIVLVEAVHIPYKGDAPALLDIMAGQVDFMFDPLSAVLAHVRSGKMRALAIGSERRSALLPDVPTMREAGVAGFSASVGQGFLAPKGSPKAAIQKLNVELNQILNLPEVRASFERMGADVLGGPPETFVKHLAEETRRFGEIIRSARITAE